MDRKDKFIVNPVTHLLGRELTGSLNCHTSISNKVAFSNSSDCWSSDSNKLLIRQRFASAKNLYRKDLFSHFGCVNAIEFSRNGEWLLSGKSYNEQINLVFT